MILIITHPRHLFFLCCRFCGLYSNYTYIFTPNLHLCVCDISLEKLIVSLFSVGRGLKWIYETLFSDCVICSLYERINIIQLNYLFKHVSTNHG